MKKVEIPDEDVEIITDGIDMCIEMQQNAKDYLEQDPGMRSPEQLVEFAADFDDRRAALQRVRNQLGDQNDRTN